MSSGRLHSCGILIDETLECWGVGAPIKKPAGFFEQVSSGDFHSCAILKDQSIQCWGKRPSLLLLQAGVSAKVRLGMPRHRGGRRHQRA